MVGFAVAPACGELGCAGSVLSRCVAPGPLPPVAPEFPASLSACVPDSIDAMHESPTLMSVVGHLGSHAASAAAKTSGTVHARAREKTPENRNDIQSPMR